MRDADPPRRDSVPLEPLIRENLGWLRGWLGARLRGARRQDVDDLCQEVLLRVVRGAGELRHPDKFPAWLYRIANNVLRDHLRRQKIRAVERAGLDVDPVDPRDVEFRAEREEELERTMSALLDLPPRYREPMLLRHVEDLSYADIGRVLGISENAVQVRIFRARKMLQAALADRSGPTPAQPDAVSESVTRDSRGPN